MQKAKWSLNQAEFKAFFRNMAIGLAPIAITELTLLSQGNLNLHTYLYAFEMWAIYGALDFFRKAKAETVAPSTTTTTVVTPAVTTVV